MEKEELNTIITQLESSNSVKDAYFSIEQYGGGPDECFIKSNKEGLELIASQLLQASRDFDEAMNNEEKSIIPFDDFIEDYWNEGDVFFDYVKPIHKQGNKIVESTIKESIKDKLIGILFMAGGIVLIIAILVGLGTMISWLF